MFSRVQQRSLRRITFATAMVLSAGAAVATSALGQGGSAPQRDNVAADDGHKLTVWSKRPAGEPRGEIVLLHGRTWSALPNFDLHATGQHVSLMDALVARGYAVYALDQRGYGSTPRDKTGWLTPDRAAKDAAVVADWVAARAPRSRHPAVLGYSRGSMTALLFAQRHPEKLSTLILYGFAYDVSGVYDTIPEPSKPPRAKTTEVAAGEDFTSPDSTAAGVKEAYVRDATMRDPVRVDWRREEQFGELSASALRTPTLVINGENDPVAKGANIPEFLSRLSNMDRNWVVLAASDHVAHLERQQAFVNALLGFIERAQTKR